MGPEMRNLLLRYFDLNTISMHRIGSSLSRLKSALLKSFLSFRGLPPSLVSSLAVIAAELVMSSSGSFSENARMC